MVPLPLALLLQIYNLATASEGWAVLQSANLDTHGKCGCADSSCHDITGFHFVGRLLNDTACANSCKIAGPDSCKMWFRSSHSDHCWWKLGNSWDPLKAAGITSGCLSTAVPGCGKFPPPPPPKPLPTIISGQGKFRYRY